MDSPEAIRVKGTVPQYFRLQVFSWISFPQAPEYPNRAISNFLENSRRYSYLKVHHRWQREKIFSMKSFNYFVWIPLGIEVHFKV